MVSGFNTSILHSIADDVLRLQQYYTSDDRGWKGPKLRTLSSTGRGEPTGKIIYLLTEKFGRKGWVRG